MDLKEIERMLGLPNKPQPSPVGVPLVALPYLALDGLKLAILACLEPTTAYKKAKTYEQKLEELGKILQTLASSNIEDSLAKGSEAQIHVNFAKNASEEICTLIQEAINKATGLNDKKLFTFKVFNTPNSRKETAVFQSPKENLRTTIGTMLERYSGRYFKFSGDLNAEDIVFKNTDNSWISNLTVTGTFKCDKHNKIFPAKVGTLDCYNLRKNYITPDTQLPEAKVINCAYSVTGFDVLMDILPSGLRHLIVEPGMIRLEPNPQNPDAPIRKLRLATAREFRKKYPRLKITDTNGKNLSDILKRLDNEGNLKPIKKPKTAPKPRTTPTNTLPNQIIGQHLSVPDLIMFCRTIPDKYGKDKFPENNDLKDPITRALLSGKLKTKKFVIARDGHTKIQVIDISEFELFTTILDQVIVEDEKAKAMKQVAKQTVHVVMPQKQQTVQPTKTNEQNQTKIVKYIQPSVFDEIVSDVNYKFAMQVLHDIESVNTDPSDPTIKNNTSLNSTAPTKITKAGGCYIKQTNGKEKTIIWIVAQDENGNKIFVCQGFFKKNTRPKKFILQQGSRKLQTFTKEELNDYISVSSLIEFDKAPKPGPLIQQHFGRNLYQKS